MKLKEIIFLKNICKLLKRNFEIIHKLFKAYIKSFEVLIKGIELYVAIFISVIEYLFFPNISVKTATEVLGIYISASIGFIAIYITILTLYKSYSENEYAKHLILRCGFYLSMTLFFSAFLYSIIVFADMNKILNIDMMILPQFWFNCTIISFFFLLPEIVNTVIQKK